MDLLSRAGTVVRLIRIRKKLFEQEENFSEPPDKCFREIKKELDELLKSVIGVPDEGKHEINNVLQKAIRDEIKPKTAAVAVHEIYREYQEKKNSNKLPDSGDDIETEDSHRNLEELYKSGYR